MTIELNAVPGLAWTTRADGVRAQADEALRASEMELRRAHAQLAVEKHLLEMTASGRPLDEVLDAVCRFVEELSPECLCGVYPIDWSGPI
jgi:hypothetical protein